MIISMGKLGGKDTHPIELCLMLNMRPPQTTSNQLLKKAAARHW
jgi:hypothetical protein